LCHLRGTWAWFGRALLLVGGLLVWTAGQVP